VTHYTAAEQLVYREAMQILPGMLGASTVADNKLLLTAYHQRANECGVGPMSAWGILSTAGMHWLAQLADVIAAHAGCSREDVARDMASTVALWDIQGAQRARRK